MTNIITPMSPYFALALTFLQKYYKTPRPWFPHGLRALGAFAYRRTSGPPHLEQPNLFDTEDDDIDFAITRANGD